MDANVIFEEYIYRPKDGVSEFRAVAEGGKRMAFRGRLDGARAGARLLLLDVTGPDRDGCMSYRVARERVETESEAAALLSCAGGISEKIAKNVVAELGIDIAGYPSMPGATQRLMAVPGIGAARASSIIAFAETLVSSNDEYDWLRSLGISGTAAMRAIKKYGKGIKEKVTANPYSLFLDGLCPFEAADDAALSLGSDIWDSGRISAVAKYALDRQALEGNTRVRLEKFARQCSSISAKGGKGRIPQELFSLSAFSMPKRCKVTAEGGTEFVYPLKEWLAEMSIACDLRRVKRAASPLPRPTDSEIDAVEREVGIRYNKEQREAFSMFSEGGVLIMTGDPGTGKTTTIDGLIRFFLSKRPDGKVLLCAPTGRAASKLAEKSGHKGLTMHRAMKLTPYDSEIRALEQIPEDLVIADEMSMCDTELFSYFMSSVKSGATLLLTGDPRQLPSVGSGNVFGDLIASGKFPVYRLTELVRQEAQSGIVLNARAVLAGKPIRSYQDFEIVRCRKEDIAKEAVSAAKRCRRLPMVLCPVKGGTAGVRALNEAMQEAFRKSDRYATVNGFKLYEGDPIIMTHNNYRFGYFNGEIGRLIKILGGSIRLDVMGRPLVLDTVDACDVMPAYAMTIHKAQGSEAEECIIVLPEGCGHMASAELLNTAFTRAKKRVCVIGTEESIRCFMQGAKPVKRECGLMDRLEEALPVSQLSRAL